MDSHRNILVLLAGMLIFTVTLKAQNSNLRFDQIGLENGLSQSTVFAITQDAQGFIWFGTQDGLNRYDGYSVTVFKNNPSDSNSLSDNTIRCLFGDSKGNLWIGTLNAGLDRYSVSENKFYHYQHNENDSTSVAENNITAIYEDSKGNIWIGTQSRGLQKFNYAKGTFSKYNLEKNNPSGPASNAIWAIKEDKNNNLWVATSNGLCKLKSGSDLISPRRFYIDEKNILRNNILSISFDKDGILWAGTGLGLNKFDMKREIFSGLPAGAKIPDPVSVNTIRSVYGDSKGNLWIAAHDAGLFKYNKTTGTWEHSAPYSLRTIYEDRSGIIWMGTSADGVKIYDQRKNRFRHYYPNQNNLKDNIVFTILEDTDGELWTGVYNSGLFRFNKQRNNITGYSFNPKDPYGISNNIILSLCQTSDNKIWAGTAGGGINCFDKKTNRFEKYFHDPKNINSISSNLVSALFEDKAGNLWIGHLEGGLDCYLQSEKKFIHYFPDEEKSYLTSGKAVIAVYEGINTGLWVGINNGGIYHFSPETKSFKYYNLSLQSNVLNNNNTALCFYEDNSGKVWMGTYGSGLCRFDSDKNTFEYFTTSDGLSNDVVYGILPDKSGNLWLSTNKGISNFNPVRKTFKNYDMKDGLQSNEFNQAAFFRSSSGELFFGGINGLSAFYPEEIKDNEYIPPVYLSSFKIFDETLPLPSPIPVNTEIELSYSQNFFSFEFVSLNYTLPERNMYAYKLEGFDDDWHNLSAAQRYGSYSNLDPGEYKLMIKASNNDGIWNEAGSSVTIIITPPFWMTWWFKVIVGLLLSGIIAAVIMQRVSSLHKKRKSQEEISRRLIEKEEQERKRIAGELHDSIGQELIVIKNRAKIGSSDEKEAVGQLTQISQIAASALQTVRSIAYNLRPYELDRIGLTQALKGMIRRISETTSIKFTLKIDSIDGKFSPDQEIKIFRIVQEFLNNTLKHSCATEVVIEVMPKQGEAFLRLFDNGKGFIPGQEFAFANGANGFGLPGIMERIRILGASHKLNSAPGAGTELILQIPIKQNEKKL